MSCPSLRLSDGAYGTAFAIAAPSSLDCMSLMTLYFRMRLMSMGHFRDWGHALLARWESVDFVDLPLSFDIFDIDDEIAQHDSNDDSSSASNSGPIDQRVSPATWDTKMVDFGIADQPRELRIGLDLSIDERDSLVQLLKSYLDVLAWSYEDMSGLDPSVVKEEIQKQLSVGFLSVVEYPKWLANVVHVPKKDGKVRVCVDFQDLNKVSPKDDFLSHTLTC
ncbi:hypothetical protein AAG906_025982 [Vitis piasezkii]